MARRNVVFANDDEDLDVHNESPSSSDVSLEGRSKGRHKRRRSLTESLENGANTLKKRASHAIIEVPVTHIKNLDIPESLGSLERETQYFVGITAMHGVLRIYKSHGWSRFFWAIVYIVCGGLLLWQCINIFEIFFNRPVVSQVSFLIAEEGLLFPKVTLCNFNPIRKTYISQLNATGQFSSRVFGYLMQSNDDVLSLYGNGYLPDLQIDDAEYKDYIAQHPNFTLDHFFFDAGFDCEDTMKICSFSGRQFDCCRHTQPVLTSFGKCLVLNLQSAQQEWMRKQTEEGVDSGLQLVLDAHLEEQYDEDDNDFDPSFSDQFENGFRLTVDEPDTTTYKTSEAGLQCSCQFWRFQGISGSPGDRIYAALTSKTYRLLDKASWGTCRSEWPEGFSGSSLSGKYSQEDCASKCKAKFYNDQCGCSPFVYNIDREYPTCTPLETYECTMKHAIYNTSASGEEFRWPDCKECTIECTTWEYESHNSYSHGFSKNAIKWLTRHNPEWTAAHIRSNFITINVFFRDMTYTAYEQVQATTFAEVMSNIGGNMGMFWGMSLITVAETLMYLTKISWMALSKKRRDYLKAKKEREEDEQRENEETLKHLRELGHDKLAGIAAAHAQFTGHAVNIPERNEAEERGVAGRFRKFTTQFNSFRKRKFGKVHPSGSMSSDGSRKPSEVSNGAPKKSRDEFMRSFYDNRLHGNGRADIYKKSSTADAARSRNVSVIPEEEDSRVLQLKINLADLQRRVEDQSQSPSEIPFRIVERKHSHCGETSRAVFVVDETRGDDSSRVRFSSDPLTTLSRPDALDNTTLRPRGISMYVEPPKSSGATLNEASPPFIQSSDVHLRPNKSEYAVDMSNLV